jgi:hypothetical protein
MSYTHVHAYINELNTFINHYKPIHYKIFKIQFEYTYGYNYLNTFATIGTQMGLIE